MIKTMEDHAKESKTGNFEDTGAPFSQVEFTVEDVYLLKDCLLSLEETLAKRVNSKAIQVNTSYPGDTLLAILAESTMGPGKLPCYMKPSSRETCSKRAIFTQVVALGCHILSVRL